MTNNFKKGPIILLALIWMVPDCILGQENDNPTPGRFKHNRGESFQEMKERILEHANKAFQSGRHYDEVIEFYERAIERRLDRRREDINKRFIDNPQKREYELLKLRRQSSHHQNQMKRAVEGVWKRFQSGHQHDKYLDRELNMGIKAAFKKYRGQQDARDVDSMSKKIRQDLLNQGFSANQIDQKMTQFRRRYNEKMRNREQNNLKQHRRVNELIAKGRSREQIQSDLRPKKRRTLKKSPPPKSATVKNELKEKGYSEEEINSVLEYLED